MLNKIIYLSLALTATGCMQAMNQQATAGTQTNTAQIETKRQFDAEATEKLEKILLAKCDDQNFHVAALEEQIKAGADFNQATNMAAFRAQLFLGSIAPRKPVLLETVLEAGADLLTVNEESLTPRIFVETQIKYEEENFADHVRIARLKNILSMLEKAEKLQLTTE
jgi:hypothetical protein